MAVWIIVVRVSTPDRTTQLNLCTKTPPGSPLTCPAPEPFSPTANKPDRYDEKKERVAVPESRGLAHNYFDGNSFSVVQMRLR